MPQLHLSKQGSSVGGTSVSRACVVMTPPMTTDDH